jgi:hypothetical protein
MEKMYATLERQLIVIANSENNILKREEKSVELCVLTLTELKAIILKNGFQSKRSEIDFFKRIKPRFESKLKYHVALFDLEKHKPRGSESQQRKYYEKKLKEIDDFTQTNLEFYTYYKTGAMHFDDLYFIRGKHSIQLALQSCVFDIDVKFRTSHDTKISRILANEMLQAYLLNELALLDGRKIIVPSQDHPKIKLNWTDSKAALIELIYALFSQGVFENASADIKEIAAYFEMIFNVDLGDYYRTYLDLKTRKSGRTKFLDGMRENLIKRMDFGEELPPPQKSLF